MSPYFTPEGDPKLFRCGCGRPECSAPAPSQTLLDRLELLRHRIGRSLRATSGPRCPFWNTHEGGARTSDHLTGEGVDLEAATSGARDELLEAIYTKPRYFPRVGIGSSFVHVGLEGPERPPRLTWTYYPKPTPPAKPAPPPKPAPPA